MARWPTTEAAARALVASEGGAVPGVQAKGASRGAADPSLGPAIVREATRLGVSPVDLATAIGYETAGTYSPNIIGGAGNAYRGLIQFGPTEQRQYGIVPGMTADDQMKAVGRFLQDRGLQPGSGLLDIYSTINAGSPGHYDARDASGLTVAQHVQNMQKQFGPTAQALVGGQTADVAQKPITDNPIEGALSVDGQPMWVRGSDATAQPVTDTTKAQPVQESIPAGKYGIENLVTALKSGDAAQIKQASAAVLANVPFMDKINGSAVANISSYIKALPGAAPETAKVIDANYRKDPGIFGAAPPQIKPALDAAVKATESLPAPTPAVTSSGAGAIADWAPAQQTGSITDLAINAATASPNRVSAWSSPPASSGASNAYDSFQSSRPAPQAPYPKTDAPSLGSALTADKPPTSFGAGLSFPSGFGTPAVDQTPPPAAVSDAADPLSQALTIPTVAAHVGFTPPAPPPVATPPAVVQQAKYPGGPMGGSPIPHRGMSAFSANLGGDGGGLGGILSPGGYNAWAAGVHSAGLTATPYSSLAGLAQQGYHMPNFDTTSGGSNYAYKTSGDGHGSYVDENNHTWTY